MASDLTIEIITEWFQEEPNFKPCDACGDMMACNTNGLYLFFGAKLLDEEPAIELCNACCNV